MKAKKSTKNVTHALNLKVKSGKKNLIEDSIIVDLQKKKKTVNYDD